MSTPPFEFLPLPGPVVGPGDFVFAVAHLDHAHIHSQCRGLLDAGGTLKWVYDPEPPRVEAFLKTFPGARVARSLDELLADPEVRLVAAAAVPDERYAVGLRVMDAGKDYFTDKCPFTTLDQLAAARAAVARTGRKYAVYYNERVRNESAVFATRLVREGAVGRVLHVLGLGPHRLNAAGRPPWFFKKKNYGGILCDIGSHHTEQFLTFAGAADATVTHAAVANHANPAHPELEDFGEASLLAPSGATNYFRVDWFTPDGLGTWGDGRIIIMGTKGTLELRKYIDFGRERGGDHVYLADDKGEHRVQVAGKVGFPFFGELILDCLHRTERAMTQAHAFKAAELALVAQARARVLTQR